MSAGQPARFDVAVIGAGIAGAAAAYELASTRRVALIEREEQPGYHTTGRSAALYTENYGNAVIRALTFASRPFFDRPPNGFSDHPLLTPRGTMLIAAEGQARACDAALAAAGNGNAASLSEITLDEALRRVPVLDPAYVRRALFEPAAMDMDVHAIHQGFLRGFRARGGRIALDAEVRALDRLKGEWRLATKVGQFAAPRVVNATGAWVDEIAKLAGLRPIAPRSRSTRCWAVRCRAIRRARSIQVRGRRSSTLRRRFISSRRPVASWLRQPTKRLRRRATLSPRTSTSRSPPNASSGRQSCGCVRSIANGPVCAVSSPTRPQLWAKRMTVQVFFGSPARAATES
jgi:glycine/D-amino acid oxidase-like deaminating enzyme